MAKNELKLNKEMPFITKLSDDTWKVDTKVGTFTLQEQEWEKVERARKRAPNSTDIALVSDSIIEFNGTKRTFGEEELGKMKGSVIFRLLAAINQIYEVDDFLSE